MKNSVLVLFFFSCLFVSANSNSLVTYNVNYHFINKDVVNILDSINADVVCLQETNVSWETILREGLKNKYSFILFNNRGTAGGYGTLSKYPIIRNDYIKNKVGWFSSRRIIIKKG